MHHMSEPLVQKNQEQEEEASLKERLRDRQICEAPCMDDAVAVSWVPWQREFAMAPVGLPTVLRRLQHLEFDGPGGKEEGCVTAGSPGIAALSLLEGLLSLTACLEDGAMPRLAPRTDGRTGAGGNT
ncbi:hypothetical protein AAFF_G00425410 [Aldrovandia affinis]|uniref:Uncharacterized protein n=1 Tax=Aldrovandia affinis TaxID=143900 RepID=A0AAD7T700_9TELE|nr:hypothetical protein AAFF_G00425410 [Aldrovandia affinis]